MRIGKRSLLVVAMLMAFAVVAAACSSNDNKDNSGSSTSTTASSGGGTVSGKPLVIGAEQEPDCVDWIGSCGGSSWGAWMMKFTTLPEAFDIVKNASGTYVYKPGPVLAGEPTLQTTPNQVVTYKINPKAVWNDGTPITSADFKYMWDQIANGSDIYDPTGYTDIQSVDTPDPQTAVVTFSTPYAGWRSLFGGNYGLMPSHLLEGKDRSAEMANGYSFSGGPWKIDHWTKGVEAVLVPNDKYWGPKPKIKQVVFRFTADTSTEFQAFKAGETSVIYPQPQPDAVAQIKAGLPDTNSSINAVTGNIEALWLQNGAAPFNDPAVREAVGYAIDRNAIVRALFGSLGVTKAAQSFNPPILAPYSDPTQFSRYTKNLPKVASILKGAGWAKGSDGIWAKNGQKLAFTLKTTAGNQRRALTGQILQKAFKDAGMEMSFAPEQASVLFGQDGPDGNFQMALYAQVATSIDPSLCNLFCSKNIPQPPDNSGQNWTRTNIPAADPVLASLDTELVPAKAKAAGRKVDKYLADDATSFPLDPLPNILLWNKAVKGPVQDNSLQGPFFNMNLWTY